MKTLSFFGTCGAGAEKCLASGKIQYPFRLVKIRAKFAAGCENLLKLRFFACLSDDEPSSGTPEGVSLLADNSYVDYLVGEADAKDLEHDVEVPEGNMYLVVHGENGDFFDHQMDVQLGIEPL